MNITVLNIHLACSVHQRRPRNAHGIHCSIWKPHLHPDAFFHAIGRPKRESSKISGNKNVHRAVKLLLSNLCIRCILPFHFSGGKDCSALHSILSPLPSTPFFLLLSALPFPPFPPPPHSTLPNLNPPHPSPTDPPSDSPTAPNTPSAHTTAAHP